MATTWREVAGAAKIKTVRPVDNTPPRTPSEMSTSAHNLVSQLQSMLERLSSLETLVPGEEINTMLTSLVNLCIAPYTSEFTTYVLNMEGISLLCEQLRSICAMAEGELEKYWAHRILQDASSGAFTVTASYIAPANKSIRNSTPNLRPSTLLPILPKLPRPLPTRMLDPRSLPPISTAQHRIHRLWTTAFDFALCSRPVS